MEEGDEANSTSVIPVGVKNGTTVVAEQDENSRMGDFFASPVSVLHLITNGVILKPYTVFEVHNITFHRHSVSKPSSLWLENIVG
jgi:hypothetical protein